MGVAMDDVIEAFGLIKIIDVTAVDGFVIITALMRGDQIASFAMHPNISADLRPRLRDAERIAKLQRNEKNLRLVSAEPS